MGSTIFNNLENNAEIIFKTKFKFTQVLINAKLWSFFLKRYFIIRVHQGPSVFLMVLNYCGFHVKQFLNAVLVLKRFERSGKIWKSKGWRILLIYCIFFIIDLCLSFLYNLGVYIFNSFSKSINWCQDQFKYLIYQKNPLFLLADIYLLIYPNYFKLYGGYGAFLVKWILSSNFAYKATAKLRLSEEHIEIKNCITFCSTTFHCYNASNSITNFINM